MPIGPSTVTFPLPATCARKSLPLVGLRTRIVEPVIPAVCARPSSTSCAPSSATSTLTKSPLGHIGWTVELTFHDGEPARIRLRAENPTTSSRLRAVR